MGSRQPAWQARSDFFTSTHPMPTLFLLDVRLRGVRPAVWRRLLVAGDLPLSGLHRAIQIAFGWTDSHLHGFTAGRDTCGPRPADGDPFGDGPVGDLDEARATVAQIAGRHPRFFYEYDFGDGWVHVVRAQEGRKGENGGLRVACTGGAGAGPPEDCGGAGAYQDMLLAFKPGAPTGADGPEGRSPFDMDEVNRELALAFPPE